VDRPLRLADLRGKVLLDFWTHGSITDDHAIRVTIRYDAPGPPR
jgi:hypothetical protein